MGRGTYAEGAIGIEVEVGAEKVFNIITDYHSVL